MPRFALAAAAFVTLLILSGCAHTQQSQQAPVKDTKALAIEAKKIAAAAIDAYRACSTYQVRIQWGHVVRRNGVEIPESESFSQYEVAYTRAGLIRVDDKLETNGLGSKVAWGGSKTSGELMEAPRPAEAEVSDWIIAQPWLPEVTDVTLQAVLGEQPAAFLVREIAEITDVRRVVRHDRWMKEVVGNGVRAEFGRSDPIAIHAWFSEATGLLSEIAYEDAASQRQQDKYKRDISQTSAQEAWEYIRFQDQALDKPISEVHFAPPAEYLRQSTPASSMGPRILRQIGSQVHEQRELGLATGKATIVMTTFAGMGIEYLPAMDWIHDRLASRGVKVVSMGPDVNGSLDQREPKRSYRHEISRNYSPHSVAGVQTQIVAPMLFLIGSDQTLQTVFTGYMPVYSLLLRDMGNRLAAGEQLWTREQIREWQTLAPGARP